jgi:DnaJ-class molecular chaperone
MVGFDGSEMESVAEEVEDWEGPCHRCSGRGHVPILLESAEESMSGETVWGDRDCPDCGGSGRQRDPMEVAELRAQYGPGWNE